MDKDIQTVFFDVGNTLRIVLPDKPFIEAAEAELDSHQVSGTEKE